MRFNEDLLAEEVSASQFNDVMNMIIKLTRQNDRPILILDRKGNTVVDIENNHVELTLENNSILIIPSVELYYAMVSDARVFNGTKEVNIDTLFKYSKITLVNCKINDFVIAKVVSENKYKDENIYLIQIDLEE